MDANFWLERWARDQIGFHQAAPHPMLRAHWARLELAPGSRVFVPLCGKSHDLAWLHEAGHVVTGIELSDIAVRDFLREHGVVAERRETGPLACFEAPGYRLFQGDFFALGDTTLGHCDAIYDRAALVALPPTLRRAYVERLDTLAVPGTAMLLITVGYDTNRLQPPPFVVGEAEVEALYGAHWHIERLAEITAPVKGEPGTETVYLLRKR